MKNFEDVNPALNLESNPKLKEVYDIIVLNFKSRPKGKNNRITNKFMRERLSIIGYEVSDIEIRKIIQHIRSNDIIWGLCSDSKGYYVAQNEKEIKDTLQSLKERIEAQINTFESLKRQYTYLTNQNKIEELEEKENKNKKLL